MIRAAVAYADRRGPPPYPLRYALQAEMYGALPCAGGLRDQPVALLNQMAACLNIYQAWQAYNAAPDKFKFVKEQPAAWRVVQEILNRDANH